MQNLIRKFLKFWMSRMHIIKNMYFEWFKCKINYLHNADNVKYVICYLKGYRMHWMQDLIREY